MTSLITSISERRSLGSIKWNLYTEDVLPLWVADLDFAAPQAIIEAIQRQAATGEFGYSKPSDQLLELLCERMRRLYAWHITPEQIVFIPSLVTGLHAVCRLVGSDGDGVLMQTPVYPPFLSAATAHKKIDQHAPLVLQHHDDGTISYTIDFDVFEETITDRTRLFLLCNPHNPTGAAYSREDQLRMAEICLDHNLIICSDEIHCDLLHNDTKHIPIASLSADISQSCITMMAPSKSFNVPGLKSSFLIIQNEQLREAFLKSSYGIVPAVNNLGLAAMYAAYHDCDDWLQALRHQLTQNRDSYVDFLCQHLPQLHTTVPAATYLAWIDCSEAGIEGSPYKFFLEKAKVALNDGTLFGTGGEAFVRLNFGCPAATLMQALERMSISLRDSAK